MGGDLNRPNKINGFTGITEHTESKKQQRSRCEGFNGQIRTRHFAIMTLFFLNAGGEDFLVLEVLLERNAARHDGCELHVIHKAAAGIGSEILFHKLFHDSADARG